MGWVGFNRNSISTVFPEKGKNFQMASTLILKIQPHKKIIQFEVSNDNYRKSYKKI